MCQNILLPSYFSTGTVFHSVVESICHHNDMGSVKNMFLPVHIEPSHWGLAIFTIAHQTVYFDDGYHCPIPENLKQVSQEILDVIFQSTGNAKFQQSNWRDVRRFLTPMPDQQDSSSGTSVGCGSCGVAVICTIQDVCNGKTGAFTWMYKDAQRLRDLRGLRS